MHLGFGILKQYIEEYLTSKSNIYVLIELDEIELRDY